MTVNGFDLDPLAGLDATPAEREALAEALAELGEIPPGGYGGGELPPGWDDEVDELANEYGLDPGGLDLAADPYGYMQAVELANAAEAQRLAEDELELPVRVEDRIAHLIGRIDRGTYTPHPVLRDPDDLSNGTGPGYGCGQIYDPESGRCTARFHQAACIETVRTSAATGNHEAASQYRDALRRGTPAMAGVLLSNAEWPQEPDHPADTPTYREMRRILGLGG